MSKRPHHEAEPEDEEQEGIDPGEQAEEDAVVGKPEPEKPKSYDGDKLVPAIQNVIANAEFGALHLSTLQLLAQVKAALAMCEKQ